jgi:hypothetical protein
MSVSQRREEREKSERRPGVNGEEVRKRQAGPLL